MINIVLIKKNNSLNSSLFACIIKLKDCVTFHFVLLNSERMSDLSFTSITTQNFMCRWWHFVAENSELTTSHQKSCIWRNLWATDHTLKSTKSYIWRHHSAINVITVLQKVSSEFSATSRYHRHVKFWIVILVNDKSTIRSAFSSNI